MKILLIGCGRMGGAMLKSWLALPAIAHVVVIDRGTGAALSAPATDSRVSRYADASAFASANAACARQPDIAILAVKPQQTALAAQSFARHIAPDVPILSIVAGLTLTSLARLWGPDRPLIRAMPNTPGAIGLGSSAYCSNKFCEQIHLDVCNLLLKTLGNVHHLTDEKQIDAVTALSGSGPAYVYNLVEALCDAGIFIGLDPALAAALARETLIGAAALLAHEKDTPPAALRQAVTSPGGTTEAALKVIMGRDGFSDLLKKALSDAKKRSAELAAELEKTAEIQGSATQA